MDQTDIEYSEGKSNTRKDWIDNMIADSKKRKAEKQKNQEEAETLTKNRDEQWKNVMPSLKKSGKSKEITHTTYNKPSGYLLLSGSCSINNSACCQVKFITNGRRRTREKPTLTTSF